MEEMLQIGDFRIASDFNLDKLPENKQIINTINAYSWTMTDKYPDFKKALQTSDVLLPDGVSIVWAARFLYNKKIKKVAGADLHCKILQLLNEKGGRCFYMGASEATLRRIMERNKKDYPNICVSTYSPPYKEHFSEDDNEQICSAINRFSPDVIFVGMTAPKQEVWILENQNRIHGSSIICGIGAVFDFYAETKKRPPQWMINMGLEWFGRLIDEPRRLWKRYLVYNAVFLWQIFKLKLSKKTY